MARQALVVRFTEDLILRVLEGFDADRYAAQCIGEKLRRQVGRNPHCLISGAVGVILKHHTDAGSLTPVLSHFFALRMNVPVVFHRSKRHDLNWRNSRSTPKWR